MEQFVVQFPALAAWLLVGVGGFGVASILAIARMGMKRLDSQDETLGAIKNLLEDETKQLRELHHSMDKRVIKLEEFRQFQERLREGH